MIAPRPLRESDLAPGDLRSHTFDWGDFEIVEVRQAGDEDFERIYAKLDEEFGHRGEMETREVLQQRLSWKISDEVAGHHLSYRMLALQKNGVWAALRDHTVIVKTNPSPRACVHLSHVLVAPEWRRTGLAGWMRAIPVEDARRACVELGLSPKTPITLVAEMEPFDSPEQLPRLKAYARAGFRRVDPSRVNYHQPDFRPFAEIDTTGGTRPLPFWLMVRQVGQEKDDSITGLELRRIVDALYAMYAQAFRAQDMAPLYQGLENYPRQREPIALQDIRNLLT